MLSFDIFDQPTLAASTLPVSSKPTQCATCAHLTDNSEFTICVDCGRELPAVPVLKEWRNFCYERTFTRHHDKTCRVQTRVQHTPQDTETPVYNELSALGFSEQVIRKTIEIYREVTDALTVKTAMRGQARNMIVYACTYHAFKLLGKPQSHERLLLIFNLTRKTGLKGLKFVNLNTPKNSIIHSVSVTPHDIIREYMDRFNATEEQKQTAIDLYTRIYNRSSELNRARPQSICAGVVYYWSVQYNTDISIRTFARLVNVSELTILKIYREIVKINP